MKKCFFFFLILGISVLVASEGGPDDYGYRWIDSDSPGGPVFEWNEIDWVGTSLGWQGEEDDEMYTLILPEPFVFYGIEYDTLNISSNGWLCLGYYDGWARTSLPTIPDEDIPNALISPMGMDLNPRNSSDDVYYYWDMANRKFTVEFKDIVEYSSGPMVYSFQVIFDFRVYTLLFQYLSAGGSTSRDAEIGIENETGEIGLRYGRDEDMHNNLAILFYSDVIISPPYFTDLEEDESRAGFVISDTTRWQIGNPIGVGPGGCYSGTTCFGTNLYGTYGFLVDESIYSPMFNASGLHSPFLEFYHWYHTEEGVDGGNVHISIDRGYTWYLVHPVDSYPVDFMEGGSAIWSQSAYSGSQREWQMARFDLSDYGDNIIQVRFQFASDSYGVPYPGWYIDDISFYQAFGFLEGRVELGYAEDYSNVRVYIPTLNITTMTDSTGYFRFDSLSIGNWRVEFSIEGYATQVLTGVNVGFMDTTFVSTELYPELFYTDFEDESGSFIASEGWEWGNVNRSLQPTNAFSGNKLWGTNLEGDYENNCNWQLDFELSLGEINYPGLEYWQWYKFERGYAEIFFDGGNVKISTDDGETFELITPLGGYPGMISSHNAFLGNQRGFGGDSNGNFWHSVRFNLSRYAHNDVIIRFEIGTDNTNTAPGWYIDDVRIMELVDIPEYSEAVNLPEKLSLKTYPNPFNSELTLEIDLPQNSEYEIHLYNTLGNSVYSIDGISKGGRETLKVNPPSDIPSGVYCITLNSSENQVSRKVVLLK